MTIITTNATVTIFGFLDLQGALNLEKSDEEIIETMKNNEGYNKVFPSDKEKLDLIKDTKQFCAFIYAVFVDSPQAKKLAARVADKKKGTPTVYELYLVLKEFVDSYLFWKNPLAYFEFRRFNNKYFLDERLSNDLSVPTPPEDPVAKYHSHRAYTDFA